MKSSKKICEIVRKWALEICMEDGVHLLQQEDGVIPDEEHITLHICDKNYAKLASIEVHKINGAVVFLTDDEKSCLCTLRECDGFEPIVDRLFGWESEFFTSNRTKELRRRLKDLLEIKKEKIKYKPDDIKEISDSNKHTDLRPDNVDIRDITNIVHEWTCDVCREKGLMPEFKPDHFNKPRFDFVIPAVTFYEATVVIEKLEDGFDIMISDNRANGVVHVTYKATGKVATTVSGSFKIISRERVKDLANRLRYMDNSAPVKNAFSLSPNSFALGLNKITPLTLTHDIIQHGHAMRRWCFDKAWISPKYDVLDADKQYRRRIDYLIDKFRRLSAEYGRVESALAEIPNIPLEEYCTRKFPIRRKLVLPTIETIDGKTVMHFKVDDLSERVINKYKDMYHIIMDDIQKETNSKNSMFKLFEQGTCDRPSDEVLCYAIENSAYLSSYGIKSIPDNARNYCSLAKILVLLNISSDELKDLSVEERDDMAEYVRRHDTLVLYGSGTSNNGILTSLMYRIDETDRTLEHNVVIIDNSSPLQAAVRITQLINMLINGDIDLWWMKGHKGDELEIDDPTLVDKVVKRFK